MTYFLTTIEPGDRWELAASAGDLQAGRLPILPALLGLLTAAAAHFMVETPRGPQPLSLDLAEGALVGPALRSLGAPDGHLWLECRTTDPPTLHLLRPATSSLPLPSAPIASEDGVPIAFDPQDAQHLTQPAVRASWRDFRLSLQAAQLAIVAGFDELLSTPLLRDVELLEHQLRTARSVLRRMRGRALLGDEVGLGKTVEAGMITLELAARGLARRTLILTPPSLLEQWQGELRRKFGLDSIAYDDPAFREQGVSAWGQHERIVASY